jgi:taspase, threonine aspartase, 1
LVNYSIAFIGALSYNFLLDSSFLKGIDEKMGGVLALTLSPQEECGELLWGHTTETMALGYMHVDEKPIFKISYLPTGKVPGKSLVVEGTTFKFCTE